MPAARSASERAGIASRRFQRDPSAAAADNSTLAVCETVESVSASNARTRAAFAPGADDARVIARDMEPHLTADHLRALPAYEIAVVASIGGGTTTPFTARTLPLAPGNDERARRAVAESRRRLIALEHEQARELRTAATQPAGGKPRIQSMKDGGAARR